MSNVHLVGDNSEHLNKFNNPWRTGSTRVKHSQLQILVNEHANYGGGSGPLWATEGAVARLTLRSGGHYIKGVCKKIHASSLTIEFAIHDSPYTWGTCVAGHVVALSIFDIARYDSFPVSSFSSKDIPSPRPISSEWLHRQITAEIDDDLKEQFECEVPSSTSRALINAYRSLTHYSKRYVGPEEHSGHEHASHARKTYHKAMRNLIRALTKDGLDKYKTPGCKK